MKQIVTPLMAAFLTGLAQAAYAETPAQASTPAQLPTVTVKDTAEKSLVDGVEEGGDNYVIDHTSTANKMDTPIMDTPFAVQSITRRTMDDQQAISVQDAINANTSSVVQGSPAFTYQTYTIRGFNTGNYIYMNGLRIGDSMGMDTNNVQSIDVLKGAAAMLYGLVQPGGMINLNLKRASDTPYYSLQQQFGSFGMYRTTADATGAITPDKTLLYRLNAQYYTTGSFIDNMSTNQDTLVAPSLTWKPTEQFTLNLDYQYQDKAMVMYPGLPAIYNRPAALPVSTYLGDSSITNSPLTRQVRNYVGYDATFKFNDDWSLVNRFYYQYMGNYNSGTSVSGVAQNTGAATRSTNIGQFFEDSIATNLDLKGKFETGPVKHSTLLGFDYFYMNNPADALNFGLAGYPAGKFNIYNPATYTGTGVPFSSASNLVYTQNYQNWTAAYATDQMSFFDDMLQILLGGRFDSLIVGNGFGSPAFPATSNRTNLSQAFATTSAWNPRAGIVLQPEKWISIYGNFTQTLSPNAGGYSGGFPPYPPSYGTQFEGGIKMEFFDKRLMMTLAAYDITKTNVIMGGTNLLSAPTFYINGYPTSIPASAESRGAELDITGRIDENWSVIANYTHDDVWYTSGQPYVASGATATITTQYAVAGNRLPGVPADMGNLWVKYEGDGDLSGLSTALGVQAMGQQQGDNANSYQLPAYAVANAMIGYSFPLLGKKVTAQLNLKNLFDKQYYLTASNRFNIIPGTPLNVMGALRVDF
ncbi:TonB-dependent siderophore receptor [Candidatus Methylospira mobilis]|uniref:TonB-dependent siderophore receptor n=1 Tax=Candidatus Methylospira mobilis TaxID=1808979 RepID=UPI0028ECF10A|nr:TonB-dependent siderophore receptor [Candidatus Methylospira mobilis]WNV03783.1 TonB-dependent siderophore receptor [Candidatus Methylospira mobilis]